MEENQSEELKIMPRGTAPRSLRKGRNMIAVASGKGGVGLVFRDAGARVKQPAAENPAF